MSGQITGAGGLTKGGNRTDENNTLILGNSANDYAGDTLVTKGTVKLGASEVIPHGSGKGGLAVNANTTLDLGGFSETVNRLSGAGNITSTASVGAQVNFTNDAGTGISAAKTYTHKLDFAEGTAVTINGVTFDGAGVSGGNFTLAGLTGNPTAGNANTGITPNTDGIHRLLSNFYYNGNPAELTLTGLTAGQTYEARLYNRIWGGDRNQLFTLTAGASSATMIYDNDASGSAGFIPFRYTADGSGSVTIRTNVLGAGTYHWYGVSNEVVSGPNLAFGDATNQTFSGTISGPLSLTKNGSGTQILSGDNSFTGGVTINAGTLLVNNAAGSGTGTGAVLVKSGATLGGTGFVSGAVTSEAGAILSPGASIDVLTVGSASGPATYLFEYDGAAGMPMDQLTVLGSLDLTGAAVDFDMLGTALTAPSYVFATYGSLTGTFSSQVDVPAGYNINYSFGGNQIALVQIPEPTAGLLSVLGLFGFVARRRR